MLWKLYPGIFYFHFLRVLKSLDLVVNCLGQMPVLVLVLSVELGACVQIIANTFFFFLFFFLIFFLI
jgi:hypothetical protein